MSNVENVCPQVLRGVARELRRLAASPPAGIKLVLRDDDLTDVVAHMEGPGKCSITLLTLYGHIYTAYMASSKWTTNCNTKYSRNSPFLFH